MVKFVWRGDVQQFATALSNGPPGTLGGVDGRISLPLDSYVYEKRRRSSSSSFNMSPFHIVYCTLYIVGTIYNIQKD